MRLPLSISLAGLDRDDRAPWAAGPRAAIEWAAAAGYPWVQLDGTAAGIRARELSRSGRRDLAALLRRVQLKLSGLDLWIPPEHFADPARAERAVEAVLGAIEMAGELSRLVEGGQAAVSLTLPISVPDELMRVVAAQAEGRGVRVADHALREHGSGQEQDPAAWVGTGVDPAAVLLAGREPAAAVLGAGRGLRSARLSDASGVGRVAIGSAGGRLDALGYEAALAAVGYDRPVVVDLRGVRQQRQTAERLASDRLGLGGDGG